MAEISTLSPTDSSETAAPTSSSIPMPSWPKILPLSTSGTWPRRMCRSVPQMVVVVMRTMASVGSWMVGLGASVQLFLPGPS